MAGSIWVQTIVAFVSAVVDSWKSPSEVTHTTTSTPVIESKDTQWSLTTIWDIVSPMLAQPTPRPVVVLGESPSAFVGLLDLAHKISPELVISFFFVGIVTTVAFLMYMIFLFGRILFRLVTSPCKRRSETTRIPFEHLSETAQQVYEYVRAQNPDLFVNGPDPPAHTHRRTRRSAT